MNLSLEAASWRERWVTLRNRMISDDRFRRLATRVPLMRWIARRRAHTLFDMIAGFTYSQSLDAFVRTGAFAALASRPMNEAALGEAIDLNDDAVGRLLAIAASLDLAEQVAPRRWTLGQAGAALLGSPGLVETILHHDRLYADLADTTALLKRGGGGGALSAYWRYAEAPGSGSGSETVPYSRLMAATQPMIAEQALAAYDFTRHLRMLDVGGGQGGFIEAISGQCPGLAFGLFDLPSVVDQAQSVMSSISRSKTTCHSGNFMRDPVPSGYDLTALVRILHDHNDEHAQVLLRSIFSSIQSGDSLIIVEPMRAPGATEAPIGIYFDLYLLAMGSGRFRTPGQIVRMLNTAGFSHSRLLKTPLPLVASVIVATR